MAVHATSLLMSALSPLATGRWGSPSSFSGVPGSYASLRIVRVIAHYKENDWTVAFDYTLQSRKRN